MGWSARQPTWAIACAAAALALPACSVDRSGLGGTADDDAGPTVDGARGDAGPIRDARRPDAPSLDAGRDTGPGVDAGRSDAGPTDAGPADAAPPDTGPAPGELDTLRWELVCGDYSAHVCRTDNRAEDETTMRGEPGVVYDVTLHIRGVVEEKTYNGGTEDGLWYEGGSPQDDDWTTAGLWVSDPATSYWVNAEASGDDWCVALDYMRTVPIATGATVRIWGSTRNEWSNRNLDESGDPIVIEGVPPAPDPFDGQFVQVDAVSAVPR